MPQTKTQRILFLGILIVFAHAIRILAFQGFYYNHDELQHLQLSFSGSLSDIWRYSLYETHPPLGHFIRHFWGLFGDSVWYHRHLAMLFGLPVIPMMYLVGKEVADRKTGLIAACIPVFEQSSVIYSGAIRNYSMANLFMLVALLCLFRFLRKNQKKDIVTYSALFALAAMTVYLHAVVLACFCLCAGIWLLMKKRYHSVLLLFIAGAVPLVLCTTYYLYQLPYIQPYLDTSHQIVQWNYAHHGLRQFYDYLLELLKLIVSTVMPLSFAGSYVEITLWETFFYIGVLICGIYLLLNALLASRSYQSFSWQMKLLVCSSLITLPLLLAMFYYFGDFYFLTTRRLYMFVLPFTFIYAAALARCGEIKMQLLMIAFATVSLAYGVFSPDSERTVSLKSWENLHNLHIRDQLGQQDYILFSMTGVSAYLVDQKVGLYKTGENKWFDENASFAMPDGGRVYYHQFWPCNQCDQKERLERRLKEYQSTQPYFVFLINRWEIHNYYSQNVLRCFPALPGAKILLGPVPAREESLEFFMIALPYKTMAAFLENGEAICRMRPFYLTLPQS